MSKVPGKIKNGSFDQEWYNDAAVDEALSELNDKIDSLPVTGRDLNDEISEDFDNALVQGSDGKFFVHTGFVSPGTTTAPQWFVGTTITGNGTVRGGGWYHPGDTVIVRATPDEGWNLVSFLVNGTARSSPYEFTMPENTCMVQAIFASIIPLIPPTEFVEEETILDPEITATGIGSGTTPRLFPIVEDGLSPEFAVKETTSGTTPRLSPIVEDGLFPEISITRGTLV